MAATTEDLMNGLKDLIRREKIGEAIAFLEQNKEQLQDVIAKDTTILSLLASQKWENYEQALSSRCEINDDAKQGNQIQWLPFTPLNGTIELPPIYRLLKLLLEYGMDVNAQDKHGNTPLHWAQLRDNEPMVRLLLKYGADVNAQNNYGNRPLYLAINAGKKSTVSLLLKYGADVNVQNEYGEIPLHMAAREGDESIVRLLLAKGARVDVQDTNGRTPLHWAANEDHESIVRLLLAKGARVDAQDTNGRTPLHWAASEGNESIVMLLLEYGADVSNKNTAPYWANESLVTLLSWASNAKKIDRNQQISNNEENNLQTSSAGQTTSWVTSIYRWWNSAKTLPKEENFAKKEIVVETFLKAQSKLNLLLALLESSNTPDNESLKACLLYEEEIARYFEKNFPVSTVELERLNCTLDNLQERIAANFMVENKQLSANTTGFFNSTFSGNTPRAIAQRDIPRLG
jgi:ankyrin repeat protein